MRGLCGVWRLLLWMPAFLLPLGGLASDATTGAGSVAPAPAQPAVRGETPETVSVFYLTNRGLRQGGNAQDAYSGERGISRFGRCEVDFRPIPVVNQLAPRLPFYLKSETTLLRQVELAGPQPFWAQLEAAARQTGSGAVVLFVHGYNYGFERSCRMAAEMQRYLRDKATVLVFSWPSNALPSDYVSDLADVEWSVPLLADTIRQLDGRLGCAGVRVVAHSLGSRGVILALKRLAADRPGQAVIGRLVLLAPDFDSDTFVELLPRLVPLTGEITLYASDNDTVLKLSQQLSGYPRLGQAGEYLTLADGMETIDVSGLGRYQVTGHEYFYYHPRVTADLAALLGSGMRAAERDWLEPRERGGQHYWVFSLPSMPVPGNEPAVLPAD